MIIDLTNLVSNVVDSININDTIEFDKKLLENTGIRKLINVNFNGKITKDYDMNLELSGIISGTMVLPDDITLEDTNIDFKIDVNDYVDDNFKIEKNTINILDYILQNIIVEIPSKIHNDNNKDVHLEGEGWRLITEEEFNNRSNHPFKDLSKLLDKGGK